MKHLVGRTAALHAAFWQYDPWYRRAWFVWPQATATLLAGWLIADRVAQPIGKWAKPADCTNPSNPGCAATQRVMFAWFDEVGKPTIANQATVTIDRSAFRSSAAADQPKLSAALGTYYRGEWTKAIDALKSATAVDPNAQFVTALALLIPGTTDHVRDAQTLLRTAAAAGHRQASVMLGRTLIVGWGGLAKDEQQGRKLIEDGAAAGDTYAMRLAAVGYLNREFGTYDPVKAVDLVRRAAEAGEPVAMAQLAYFIRTGRGGLPRDDTKVLDYLRRSAEAGYTDAQNTLARWVIERYENRETEDPSEGMKWYERAYQRGYNFYALVNLARAYRFARAAPWFDTQRSFALLQLCAPYAFAFCHYQLAAGYWAGAGTAQDVVKARAHYTVASQLGWQQASIELQQLDAILLPAAKTAGTQLANSISTNLKTVPWGISLQTADTDSAGPSPWAPQAAASPQSGPSSPSQQAAGNADWTTCKGNDADPALAACTRLIASGITGTDLGLAHYFKAASLHKKNQYEQAISEYGESIRLAANLANTHNDRGVAYLALGNLEAALRDLNEALRINPSFALAYSNRADAYHRQNQWDKSIADATTAIRLDPKFVYTYWVRAGAYAGKEQWMEAISDCTTAIGLSPKYEYCFNRRGWAYLKLRKYDLALADFDEAVRLQPQWTAPLYNRALVYEAIGNFEAALRDYDKAAALGDVEAMNNLGVLYANGRGVVKDYAAARRWYEKSAEKGNASGMANLGWIYANGQGAPKSYAAAKQWYEKAAALGNAWSMTELGVMYHNGEGLPQNYAEAFRWYEKAAALGEPWALFNLGVMYEHGQGVGKSRSEAINWYQKAAARGHAGANRKLQTLR
jgi:TPR repeat protein